MLISLLIDQGAHPKYIQEQAGHGSIQVTMDTYGHLCPSRDQGWTDKLDDAVGADSAPRARVVESVEQPSYKSRNLLVAVTRGL